MPVATKSRPQSKTIPLVGSFTARGFAKTIGTSSKDQQYINCLFEVANNTQLGSKIVYVNKRPGSTTGTTIASDVVSIRDYSSTFTLRATATVLYNGTTNIGTIAGAIPGLQVSDTVMNNQAVICFSDGTYGYFCFADAITTNFPTFSGDTHTNTVIDNIASTTGLYPGQLITGTGIQAGTRIATITSATAITTTIATTASATITITKEAIARVIDADYPASPVNVVALGGYMFSGYSDGRIFNSDINQPWSVGATSVVTADFSADGLFSLCKFGETIIAFGASSRQYFTITGNTSGSVLSVNRAANLYDDSQYLMPLFRAGRGYVVGAKANTGYGLFEMASPTDFRNVADPVTGALMDWNGLNQVGVIWFAVTKEVIAAFNSSATSLVVYDPSLNMFSQFLMGSALTSANGTEFTKSGSSSTFTWATGNTWQDSGSAYTMTIQSEPLSLNGGNPFVIKKATLIADTQSSGSTALSYSADDYANFTTVGSFDLTAQIKEVYGGIFVESAVIFKLADSGNNAFRGQAIIIDWEPAAR